MKRENPRMDIASRKCFPKSELLRLVNVDGVVTPDILHQIPGRGAYIRKDVLALEEAKKRKAFERVFHHPLSQEELAAIKEALK